MRKRFEKRRREAKTRAARKRARKNFLPTLIIIALLWGAVGVFIYTVDPETIIAIPVFFLLVFLALLFTLSTIFAHTRRGFIISFAILLFMILRYFGVGNLLNLVLIAALAITTEVYFTQTRN